MTISFDKGPWYRYHLMDARLTPGSDTTTRCIAITTASEQDFRVYGSVGRIVALVPMDTGAVGSQAAMLIAAAPHQHRILNKVRQLCETSGTSTSLAPDILGLLRPAPPECIAWLKSDFRSWTERDSAEATNEHWGLFTNFCECWIQRLDDVGDQEEPNFQSDQDAWRHVVNKARTGSSLHRRALAAASENEQELIRAECGPWPAYVAQRESPQNLDFRCSSSELWFILDRLLVGDIDCVRWAAEGLLAEVNQVRAEASAAYWD